MSPEDELDALYAAPLAEFLDRRKALSASLRKTGNKHQATQVQSLSKPTPAAWAVNQLAREHADAFAALLEAGESVRSAHKASFADPTSVDPADLRDASALQKKHVARLVGHAAQILERAGQSRTSTVLDRIAATLTTISTTGAWGGEQVGRLTRELEPPSMETIAALILAPSAREDRSERAISEDASPTPPAHPPEKTASGEGANLPESARAEEKQAKIAAAKQAHEQAILAEEQARSEKERASAEAASRGLDREQAHAALALARQEARDADEIAAQALSRARAAQQAAERAEEQARSAAEAARAAEEALRGAEQALSRAAQQALSAEEALVRARR